MAKQVNLRNVLDSNISTLMAIPGVVGVGEGQHEGKPCVIVFVERKTAALSAKLPMKLDGYPVIIQEVGKVKPLSN